MNKFNKKIGRNEKCFCGSKLKYKKCCLKKEFSDEKNILKNFSISEILNLLKESLSIKHYFDVSNTEKKLEIKKVNLLNNSNIIECHYYSNLNNSFDIKIEMGGIMSFISSFLKDDINNILGKDVLFFAIRAFNKSDQELMYVICSKKDAKLITEGNAIEWMKLCHFQENTNDYRISIAKKQIYEIEQGLRILVSRTLNNFYGDNWFDISIDKDFKKDMKKTYKNKYGLETNDGNVLIEYSYILQLQKIILNNWENFDNIFPNLDDFKDITNNLNNIRKEEAHNRNITNILLDDLNNIYIFLMSKITKFFPEIVSQYLLDNWKNQIKEIMLFSVSMKNKYTVKEIELEKDPFLKLVKNLTSIYEIINYTKDLELRINSLIVPVQKIDIHNELISLLINIRTNHEEVLLLLKSSNLEDITNKFKDIDKHSIKMKLFCEKFFMSLQ